MPWEMRRNGRRYFYRGRRINGRVVKEYYGCGPLAELAAREMEVRKQQRVDRRREFAEQQARVAADMPVIPTSPVASLARSTPMSTTSPQFITGSQNGSSALPADAGQRLTALAAAAQTGDRAAEGALKEFLEQYPQLWEKFGDLSVVAQEHWLRLIAKGDSLLLAAMRCKLDHWRETLDAYRTEPISLMLVERIIATWLQLAHADAMVATNHYIEPRLLDCLIRRQQAMQRQHLTAIQAWRQWRSLGLNRSGAPRPEPGPGDSTSDADWLLPFPSAASA